MPASDEFPRGWTYWKHTTGANVCGIAIPAVPNVTHVITNIVASDVCTAGADGPFNVTVSDGATVYLDIGFLFLASAGVAIGTWAGVLPCSPGLTVGIGFTSALVQSNQGLVIQGYDI